MIFEKPSIEKPCINRLPRFLLEMEGSVISIEILGRRSVLILLKGVEGKMEEMENSGGASNQQSSDLLKLQVRFNQKSQVRLLHT